VRFRWTLPCDLVRDIESDPVHFLNPQHYKNDRARVPNKHIIYAYTDSCLLRGKSLFALGQFRRSILDYDYVIRQTPGRAAAYYYRGLALDYLDNPIAAAADFAEYRQLSPQ
jgi:tetratricopeptide (TPR) repeat protein